MCGYCGCSQTYKQRHGDHNREIELTTQERLKRSGPAKHAPKDPTETARAQGRQHKNPATGHVLYPDNVMPWGKFAGRTMRQVPIAYLQWIYREQRQSAKWATVIDYVERCVLPERGESD